MPASVIGGPAVGSSSGRCRRGSLSESREIGGVMSADLSVYDEAAAQYAPSQTRVLFVAESPPSSTDRYFYFPDVKSGDSLWRELTRALYPHEFGETREERERKHGWLKRFQTDGYRLIDAVKEPGKPTRAAIRGNAARLIEKIREIDPRQVVLITVPVYDTLSGSLEEAGVPAVDCPLPFPGSGQQREFRDQFKALVEAGRLQLAP